MATGLGLGLIGLRGLIGLIGHWAYRVSGFGFRGLRFRASSLGENRADFIPVGCIYCGRSSALN